MEALVGRPLTHLSAFYYHPPFTTLPGTGCHSLIPYDIMKNIYIYIYIAYDIYDVYIYIYIYEPQTFVASSRQILHTGLVNMSIMIEHT